MITIIVPGWLVWAAIVMWLTSFALNIVLGVLTRRNNKASRELTAKLAKLALRT